LNGGKIFVEIIFFPRRTKQKHYPILNEAVEKTAQRKAGFQKLTYITFKQRFSSKSRNMVSNGNAVDPLKNLLDTVTARLAALEAHCGITSSSTVATPTSPSPSKATLQKTPSSRHISGDCTF